MTDKIDSFKDEFEFLSNFYPSLVNYDVVNYRTVEHAYQAAKTLDPAKRLQIAKLPYPGQAKKAGRKLELREDWEDVKLRIMANLLLKKFYPTGMPAWKLELTGNKELIEGNWWNDTYWGVCKGVGENHLGKLLMAIRERNRKRWNHRPVDTFARLR